ncbi:RNA-directed DNA polymerase [Paracoccus sp. YLB-12]|uniref:RNA-directed DNA polymerase n=1 Tax=Paracoccus maritimus TaxID=2933292 RepID=A0ABT2KDN7_9RHOB|nr:RNA-directed DNA polymerase [Paracoccus sp. YLB-12]MCT4334643.1 RNA-directed DNA polymerase [Paracoccus sp. YLB-12]
MARRVTAKNPSMRYRRLLSHGFFAPELPPCFVSEGLARYRAVIWRDINAQGMPQIDRLVTQTTWFHFPRFGRNDRRHGVVNPISYMAIAKIIADNFVKLRTIARRRSGMSASPLMFDWSGSRAILRPNIDLLDDFRLDLASRREMFVSADLRAFYHSVYTHTIPWAIRGKAMAKADKFSHHYANKLDRYCRNAQDQQTIGLPVGPDTSRVIGELIASAVDEKLKQEAGVTSRDASRYVDDFTISSAGGLSGEGMIAAARRAAAEFELELNHDKSAVVATSAYLGNGWKHVARSQRPPPPYDPDDFKRFFYEIARLVRELPDTNVEKWSLQNARVAFLGVDTSDWSRIQSHLINAYRRNSTIVSLLVELLIERHRDQNDVDIEGVRDFLDHRIPTLALEDRTGELIWLLFLMIALEVRIDAQRFERLYSLEEPMCALLLSAADARGLIIGTIDRSLWNRSLTAEGLRGSMWLYAYEGPRHNIVGHGSTAHIEQDPYFSILHARGVDFLSVEAGLESITGAMRVRRRADNLHHARMRRDFIDDFDVEEWDIGDEDDEYDANWEY